MFLEKPNSLSGKRGEFQYAHLSLFFQPISPVLYYEIYTLYKGVLPRGRVKATFFGLKSGKQNLFIAEVFLLFETPRK